MIITKEKLNCPATTCKIYAVGCGIHTLNSYVSTTFNNNTNHLRFV